MTNLFALCRDRDENLSVKRIQLTKNVQDEIKKFFQEQTKKFLEGIANDIDFTGDWKADDDELLIISNLSEGDVLKKAISSSTVSIEEINGNNIKNENIKALFVSINFKSKETISIQSFSSMQILSRKFSLTFKKGVFNKLLEPSFALGDSIHAIFQDNKLKFKNFSNVKRIFDLKQFYEVATDEQIKDFCSHSKISVSDIEKFKKESDQTTRRMIFSVMKSGVLDKYKTSVILREAKKIGLNLDKEKNKIKIPEKKSDMKNFFRFLDDGLYEAPLSANRYMANSKRPLS